MGYFSTRQHQVMTEDGTQYSVCVTMGGLTTSGSRTIETQDEGTTVDSFAQKLNFTGNLVDATDSGSNVTEINVNLDDTAVAAGDYELADITVDSQGRITAASSNSKDKLTTVGGDNGSGMLATDHDYLFVNGGTGIDTLLTRTGLDNYTHNLKVSLDDTAVTAGSYDMANVTIDAQGRITAATSSSTDKLVTIGADNGAGILQTDHDYLLLTGGTGIDTVVTAEGTSNYTHRVTMNLDDTAVTAGTYDIATITVDAQGRITAASDGPVERLSTIGADNGAATMQTDHDYLLVAGGTGIDSTLVSSGTGNYTKTVTLDLDDTGVTAGMYTSANITVDAQGRITGALTGETRNIKFIEADTGFVEIDTADDILSIKGTGGISTVVTESGTNNKDKDVVVYLSNTAVTAGSYTNTDLTVDAYGRITAASNGTPQGEVNNLLELIIVNVTHTTDSTEHVIMCDQTHTSAHTVTLGTATRNTGQEIIIKDRDGGAATNSITIVDEDSHTIDGASSYIISNNYGFVRLVCSNGLWYSIGKG